MGKGPVTCPYCGAINYTDSTIFCSKCLGPFAPDDPEDQKAVIEYIRERQRSGMKPAASHRLKAGAREAGHITKDVYQDVAGCAFTMGFWLFWLFILGAVCSVAIWFFRFVIDVFS